MQKTVFLQEFMRKKYEPLAQSAEHLTFNQGVRGSNPRWFTIDITEKPALISLKAADGAGFFDAKKSLKNRDRRGGYCAFLWVIFISQSFLHPFAAFQRTGRYRFNYRFKENKNQVISFSLWVLTRFFILIC